MKKIIFLLVCSFLLVSPWGVYSNTNLASKLSGRILLQVEENGEAWYVNPLNLERYFLGRPEDAFSLMRKLGLGITNKDLEKIVPETVEIGNLENQNITNNTLSHDLAGRILLQVEESGEAWYVNPLTFKRHFLGRPKDAFMLMRELGLGISNNNLVEVPCTKVKQEEIKKEIIDINVDISSFSEIKESTLNKINKQRIKSNINILEINNKLNFSTQTWLNKLLDKPLNNFEDEVDNYSLEELSLLFNYRAFRSSDLFVAGYGEALEVFDKWLEIEDNKQVILESVFNNIGIGYVEKYDAEKGKTVKMWAITLASQFDVEYFDDIEKLRAEVIVVVNKKRIEKGLSALHRNVLLENVAQNYANDMLKCNFYSHNDPEGRAPSDRVLASGYEAKYIGENIATGQTSVESVMNDWMNSPKHRENILNYNYEEIGVGISFVLTEEGFVTYWVQNFGTAYILFEL